MFNDIKRRNRLLFSVLTGICFVVICSFTTLPAAGASEVTVSTQPVTGEFGTIQAGIDALPAGGVVKIKPGIYRETVSITTDGITLEKDGFGDVVLDAEHVNDQSGITLTGVSNVMITGIKVIKVGTWLDNARDLAGIRVSGGCTDVIIDNVEVYKCKNGISLYNRAKLSDTSDPISRVQIINSKVSDTFFHGVNIQGDVNNVLVKNNVLTMSGAWSFGHVQINGGEREIIRANGIQLGGWEDSILDSKVPEYISIVGNECAYTTFEGIDIWHVRYLLVKDNYFHHNGATGLEQEMGVEYFVYEGNRTEWNQQNSEKEVGIWIGGCKYGVVRNNTVLHERSSMAVWSAVDTIIRHNVFANYERKTYQVGAGCSGINFRAMGFMGISCQELSNKSERVSFIHNTMYTPGNYALQFWQQEDLLGNKIYNKDFHVINNVISTTKKYEYDFNGHQPLVLDDFVINYNCYFTPFSFNPDKKMRIRNYDDGDVRDQSYWQNDLGFDLDVVFEAPGFVNAIDGDFTLNSDSEARNGGTYLAYTVGGGTGNVVKLTDVRYFNDGYDAGSVFEKALGDEIQIGYERVRITMVNRSEGTIEFTPAVTWTDGTPVSFVYYGEKPDMGKEEFVEADPAQWVYPHNYSVGDTVFYNGEWYTCIQAHQSNVTWTPDATVQILWE